MGIATLESNRVLLQHLVEDYRAVQEALGMETNVTTRTRLERQAKVLEYDIQQMEEKIARQERANEQRTLPSSELPELRQVDIPSGFIGRDDQLRQLDAWYEADIPIAGVFGPPGVGKSWLVRKWCAEQSLQRSTPTLYLDAEVEGYSRLTSKDEVARSIIRTLILLFDRALEVGVDHTPAMLARIVRQQRIIVVIDQLELAVQQTQEGLATEVGRLAPELGEFVAAFMRLNGPGRLILVSNIRPSTAISQFQKGNLQIISSGTSRDELQLGGFNEDEFLAFFLAEQAASALDLPDDYIIDAYMQLGGHPYGLKLFFQLSRGQQQVFLNQYRHENPLETELYNLVAISVSQCNKAEVEVLHLVTRARRAERASFYSAIGALGYSATHEALELLQRRSLIEYGTKPRGGYTAHGIIREFVRIQHGAEKQSVHRLLADRYEGLITSTEMGSPLGTDALENYVECAFHYAEANEVTKALYWRNSTTQLALEIGREARIASDFAAAKQSAEMLIKAHDDTIQTPATSFYLSGAHFHAAWHQHQQEFDWEYEEEHLRKSLSYQGDNALVYTFLITFFYRALHERIPWREIEESLQLFVQLADQTLNDTNLSQEVSTLIRTVLMRLLCYWTRRTESETMRVENLRRLRAFSEELVSRLDNVGEDEVVGLSEPELTAYYEVFDIVAKKSPSSDVSRVFTKRAEKIAYIATEAISNSPRWWLRLAGTVQDLARLALNESERQIYLQQAQEILEEMRERTVLPSGYVRRLSINSLQLSSYLPRAEAVSLIERIHDDIYGLKGNPLALSIKDDEIEAAHARLAVQAAKIAPQKRESYLAPVFRNIHAMITDPGKWLSIEMGEIATVLFAGDATDSWAVVPSELPPTTSTNHDRLPPLLKKSGLDLLDRKIQASREISNNAVFDLLRLSMRIHYLRSAWSVNSLTPPKRRIDEAIEFASRLVEENPNDFEVFSTVSELYLLLARKTSDPDDFVGYCQLGLQLLDQLLENSRKPMAALIRKARFLRHIHRYQESRTLLQEYINSERFAYRRLPAIRLFIAATSHSINPETLAGIKRDDNLVQDADFANALHLQLLEYLQADSVDVENLADAIYELQRIRCSIYSRNEELPDMTWIRELSDSLQFVGRLDGSHAIHNAQLLGDLVDHGSNLALILVTHWNKGVVWRELGSLFSAILHEHPNRQEYISYFWRTSKTVVESGWLDTEDEHRGYTRRRARDHSGFVDLNLTRALLESPKDTELWYEGKELLENLVSKQRTSWLYRRYAVEMREHLFGTGVS